MAVICHGGTSPPICHLWLLYLSVELLVTTILTRPSFDPPRSLSIWVDINHDNAYLSVQICGGTGNVLPCPALVRPSPISWRSYPLHSLVPLRLPPIPPIRHHATLLAGWVRASNQHCFHLLLARKELGPYSQHRCRPVSSSLPLSPKELDHE